MAIVTNDEYDLSDVIAIKSISSFSGITYMSKTVKFHVHGQTVFPVGLYFVVALFPPPCTIYKTGNKRMATWIIANSGCKCMHNI